MDIPLAYTLGQMLTDITSVIAKQVSMAGTTLTFITDNPIVLYPVLATAGIAVWSIVNKSIKGF